MVRLRTCRANRHVICTLHEKHIVRFTTRQTSITIFNRHDRVAHDVYNLCLQRLAIIVESVRYLICTTRRRLTSNVFHTPHAASISPANNDYISFSFCRGRLVTTEYGCQKIPPRPNVICVHFKRVPWPMKFTIEENTNSRRSSSVVKINVSVCVVDRCKHIIDFIWN